VYSDHFLLYFNCWGEVWGGGCPRKKIKNERMCVENNMRHTKKTAHATRRWNKLGIFSVVTVSHWPRSVGFGSVLRKKPRFRFGGRFSGSAVVNGCLAVSSKLVISIQYWSAFAN